MPRTRLILIIVIIVVSISGLTVAVLAKRKQAKIALTTETPTPIPSLPEPTPSPTPTLPPLTTSPQPVTTTETVTTEKIVDPIAEFKSRITKKTFGTKVSPDNSPVQPEKFSGYHTGVDVEYTDKSGEDILVRAVADGTVVTSRTASGYGGVIAIQHTLNDKKIVAVYGHLDPQSLVKNGSTVKAGEKIGILGEGGTTETDGERKHLHLSFVKGTSVNITGYVQSQAELSGWYNPLDFF
jgi:murein DD-endopeptidase MepM/ murein hydrolase activator NlpD